MDLGQWTWDNGLGTMDLGQWTWDNGLGTMDFGYLFDLQSHVPRPTSRVPCPTSRVPCPTSRVPCPTSRVPCLASHVSRPTSHVPCPTSHVPCPMSHVPQSHSPAVYVRKLNLLIYLVIEPSLSASTGCRSKEWKRNTPPWDNRPNQCGFPGQWHCHAL